MAVAVTESLLALLRERLGCAQLSYADEPRRLSGGFYTENLVFRLAGASDEWSGPLVLRLFPGPGPNELAEREAVIHNVLVDQGYPTPRVHLWDESTDVFGRSFFIMDFLPGRPLMGDIGPGQLLRSAAPFLVRLPRVLAETQARLHALDAGPLVDALGARRAGVDRWIDYLNDLVNGSAAELAEPVSWLVDNRPQPKQKEVICHGDLWPGNLLGQKRKIVAVLDWTVSTVAEPALDVGYTSMALTIAPMDLPQSVQEAVLWVSAKLVRRYIANYVALTDADLTNQPYYEAMRCLVELTLVVDYRKALQEGRTLDTPRPTWDMASDRMIDYFRARTGVTIQLPPPAPRLPACYC